MLSHVIPELISLAQTSTMSSRHAAAVISGRRVLSTATNYSLPAGELVDFAIKTTSSEGPRHRHSLAHHRSTSTLLHQSECYETSFLQKAQIEIFERKRQKCIKVEERI